MTKTALANVVIPKMNANEMKPECKLGFTLPEFLGVLVIVAIIGAFAFFNFQISSVKARDEQRKASSRSLVWALEKYQADFGVFPPSENGRMVACGSATNVSPCRWGLDKLIDLRDPNYPPYLEIIPADPEEKAGISFFYMSNGADFQFFTHLERKKDPEWSAQVEQAGLACGRKICNYGITVGAKPVEGVLEATNSGNVNPKLKK